MARDEEVEDLGDLDSTLPEASGVELAPPSDVGEGPLATAPTGEDASKAVGELAAEDSAMSAGPSQVAE
jgi:hypothetical protein